MSIQDNIETKLYQLYDNEVKIVKKYKNLDKKLSYELTIGILLFFVFVFLITGGSVIAFYNNHTIKKVDSVSFTSDIYTQWTQGVTESDTVTIPLKRVNKRIYLDIKNSSRAVNIILPLASTLQEEDSISLTFCNIRDHVDQVYYLFENYVNSIFVGPKTYYINNVYKTVKLKVINSAWTEVGSGILY